MRKEFAVSGSHGIPVYSVHIDVIKTFLMLLVDMVEHGFTFGSQFHPHFGLIADWFQCVRFGIHLLHISTSQQEYIPFLVQHQ